MTSNVDLKAIRRQVLRSYHQDGLVELTLGLSLALTGCLLLIPEASFMMWYFPWMLLIFSLPAAKKRYVAPRVGYVAIARRRKGTLSVAVALGVLFALLGVLVFVLTSTHNLPAWLDSLLSALFRFEYWAAIVGVLLAGYFGLLAFRRGFTRFYAFALLFGIGAVVVSLLRVSPGMRATLLFGIAGSVVMVSGLVVFIRFLRNNPILEEEGAGGSE